MMTKFLTREQTYGQLLKNVNENEKKLEELRAANDEKMDILNNLKINYENMKKQANDSSSQSTADNEKKDQENEEILNLKEEIQMSQKDLELVLQKKKNIHLVVDLV
jgi:chromosome segregation ATPase